MYLTIIIGLILISLYIIKREPKKDKAMKANAPLSPMHNWDLRDDLYTTNTYAPWHDVLKSTLVDPNEINLHLDTDNNYQVWNYDYESKSPPEVKLYKIDDLVFVDWRSSPDSWKHLAGRQGYIVISKSEKKQIDFIVTIMS